MTEFVLVVPFLGLILALTFILGWVLMHKHQVLVAGRHAAWRRIETGSWPSEADLDTACFADKAQDVQLSGSADGLRQTPADLVSKVGSRDNVAMSLARQLLLSRFPAGREAQVDASFDADQALWEKFSGYMTGRHGREGITWRRDEVNAWPAMRDQFCSGFDAGMRGIPAPANGMAQMVRRLYLSRW